MLSKDKNWIIIDRIRIRVDEIASYQCMSDSLLYIVMKGGYEYKLTIQKVSIQANYYLNKLDNLFNVSTE